MVDKMYKSDSKMPSELKQKWIEALRSGKYNQARYYLEENDKEFVSNCCLGVLCRVAEVVGEKSDRKGLIMFDNLSETLSYGLQAKFRMSDEDIDKLIQLNDDECKSFLEIADFIEENVGVA